MDTSLPQWWLIPNPTALNYGYTQMGGGRVGDFARVRFRLPLGSNEPPLKDIQDPQFGDLRLHTAWDKSFATPHSQGGNHVDVIGQLRQLPPSGTDWDLLWELDIPIDNSVLSAYQDYTPRLVNAWVDFDPFEGVETVQLVMWQVRSGTPQLGGIDRDDVPETPPGE